MKGPDKLADCRIAIIGLGLMGGSLAMTLKGKCWALFGVDVDPAVTSLALEKGIVERASTNLAELIPQADLLVLSTPVLAILSLLQELPNLHPGSPMVLDLGSTKRQIVQAMQNLPARFDPLGGHPMCGKETTGLASASPDLFTKAPFALVPVDRSTSRACRVVEELVMAAGACPLWLDAETHDRWTAATSHLPYLLASALALSTSAEVAPLVGPGFRSTTRVAATSPSVMLDILHTNTDNLLQGVKNLRSELDAMETLIQAGDWQGLSDRLGQAAGRQKALSGGAK